MSYFSEHGRLGRIAAWDRGKEPTTLQKYLKHKKMSALTFAQQLGVSERSVMYWIHGQALPNLVMAFKIDAVTHGKVPPESWLATEVGRAKWNNIGAEGKRHDVVPVEQLEEE